MALGAGARLGPYEIQSAIGAGGMGEVYRARDSRLKRDVALKILPESFATDPERLARFQREAEVLASLNHSNIAQIYGIEESNGTRALVMELVEGETLADRIARGAIPLDEALPIAKQIAEALEIAHEQGIIHRDLKPANIKVRPDGTVKVLDFGLAKLTQSNGLDAPHVSSALSMSPTITSPAMTGVGVLLGTAAYMSPEQAKGKPTDKRSDIWGFGCVLFEMLTGRQAFAADNVAAVLARVIEREPDWRILPASLPPRVSELLRLCLEKNPTRRRQAAGDVRIDLERACIDALTASGTREVSPRGRGLRSGWSRTTAVSLVTAIAAASGVWLAARPEAPHVSQLAIAMTPATALAINGNDRDVAVTADGSRVVYVANNGRDLLVRSLEVLEPVRLFTGSPRGPFVSPDGQWVGFIDGSAVLKKVAITGGPPTTVATIDGGSRGATWASDNTIIFASAAPMTGLQQVSAGGGPITVLTRPDRDRGDADHVWPELLPGGRSVLFTIFPVTGGVEAAQIAVLDLSTGAQTVVVRGGSHAHYVDGGYLVYAEANALHAVKFDPATVKTSGTAVVVVPEVMTTGALPGGGVNAGIAADGTLVYVRGVDTYAGQRTLVWADRTGRETAISDKPHAYLSPRISPDGSRVVTWVSDQDSDLWLLDVPHITLTRLTFTKGLDVYPVWAPDGRSLFFSSEREGARNLFSQTADGTGTAERLTRSANNQYSTAITPDGARLIFTETAPKTGEDVMQVDVASPHRVSAVVQSPFVERNGIVSPDARWLAYEANDSGQFEVYVRPYPNVTGGHWQVSMSGGTQPLWSRGGEELFFVSPTGAIMRVGVEHGASWTTTTPAKALKEGFTTVASGFIGRNYDVSSDGQRFLVLKPANELDAVPPQLIVVQHFDQELKRSLRRK
jgi:serine/threonine-protein kinase